MTTTQTVVLMAHTFIAIVIIVLVLLQRGKGADAGAAFGAGASGTVFGSRGSSNFFSRATAILAAAFFASSLALAYLSSQEAERPESLIEGAPEVVIEDDTDAGRTRDGDESPELPALDESDSSDGSEAESTSADDAQLPALDPPESRDTTTESDEEDRN
jgi:preprotein translocase subunit SecG